jgi:hypothetical protein
MFPAPPGASLDPLVEFADILAQWIDAEGRGDTTVLDILLDREFRGDGPMGFVHTKEQWLHRHRRGDLVYQAFGWQDTEVRVYDDTAVVRGIQAQTASYRGRDCSGWFHGTLVAVRRDGRWSVVNVQLSRLADPPGL